MFTSECLHKIFEARAAQYPEKIAASTMEEQITYGDLEQRANCLSTDLRKLGVGPDVLVGLCVDRSIELLIAMLAILKAGGAYVPIDPSYPEKRIQFLLADSCVDLVVAVSRTTPALHRTQAKIVLVDENNNRPEAAAVSVSNVNGSNLAYVIYTSGSTGTPKGVQIEHYNVIRLFEHTEQWFNFSADDVWTMFHSASFDFSIWEIWGALLYGGQVVIVPYEITRSPERFLHLLEEKNVTVLSQTPAAFRQLIAADLKRDRAAAWKLRYVVFGGERLDVKMLAPWITRYGDRRPELINMYGITETTVHVTYRKISGEDLNRADLSPLGVPIPDLQIYLLDAEGKPVPDGTPGEICIAGAGLARGYLRRPQLTAERFVVSTTLGPAGMRLYLSGDRAMRLPDGELVYLGRSDGQLKVRGFRVEPGEIEACIAGHPEVATAVVTAREYGEGDDRLIAYVVLRDAHSKPLARMRLTEELASRAKAELPRHMRPSAYFVVSQLPLTGHGKLDRQALAKMPAPLQGPESEAQSEMTPTECTVASIWQEVLQKRDLGNQDDFFEVGGTSLALIRILGRVNQHFGTSLDGSVLAEEATIAQLARCIDASRESQSLEQSSAADNSDSGIHNSGIHNGDRHTTATERTVCAIWEEVLRRPNIGVKEDFFDLGGTSLALIRILGLVNQRYGTSLDGSVMANDPTISCLAACIDAQRENKNDINPEKHNAEHTATHSVVRL